MVKLVKDNVVVSNGNATAEMYGNVDEVLMTLTRRVKGTIFEGDRMENEYDEHVPWIMMFYADDGDYVHKRLSFDNVPIFN